MMSDDNDAMGATGCIGSDLLDICFEPLHIGLVLGIMVTNRPNSRSVENLGSLTEQFARNLA